MHLGDQRTHGVDHVTATLVGIVHHAWCRAVRRQHDRAPNGNAEYVVNEHHTLGFESVNDNLVVHNLVVAVDRPVKRAHHPGQRLDRHFDSGTKAAGRSE